jgi:hypothetical protein
MVQVGWSGTNAVAGTSGASSAFAVSDDKGATFTDVSLIDTTLTNMRDVAIAPDNSTQLLVTDTGVGGQTSVWKKTGSVWNRVLNPAMSTGYILRTSGNSTYLFDTLSTNLLYSSDGGEKSWLLRALPAVPVDAAVESAQVVYALTAGGSVYKSTNGGFTWNDAVSTGLGNGATITSIRINQVLVGGTGGSVAYSTDGSASSTTWTTKAMGVGGNVQATADNLTNGVIYAVGSTAGGQVRRGSVGSTAPASDIISGDVPGSGTGIALNSGVLYVLDADATTNMSSIRRVIDPAKASSSTVWSAVSTGSSTTLASLSRTPSALKSTNGPKLWAINDIATDTLFSLTDTVATGASAVPAPSIPADNFAPQTNSVTGETQDVTFSWPRLSESTAYQIEVSLDSAFSQTVVTAAVAPVPATSNPVVAIISKTGAVGGIVVANYVFQPGTTYYWRVKATTPLDSPYSSVRKFAFSSVQAATQPFKLVGPEIGATGVSIKPILSWTADPGNTQYPAGAKWYEVTMSEDPSFAIPEWSHNVNGLVYGVVDDLKYNTTYYWRVRAVYADPFVQGSKVITPAGPWMVGAFTTMAEPVVVTPPSTPTQPTVVTVPGPVQTIEVPGETVVVQQPIPQWMLMTIIIIGAILVIALLVLIMRTRKTA